MILPRLPKLHRIHLAHTFSQQSDLALVCFGRNQEEVLNLHALRCRGWGELGTLALAEKGRCGDPQLHPGEMYTDTEACSRAKRHKSCFGRVRDLVGCEPAGVIESRIDPG